MPRLRHYELPAQRKFWDIVRDHRSFTTFHGIIGTPGQSSTTSCRDAIQARAEFHRAIEKKVAQGYMRVWGDLPEPYEGLTVTRGDDGQVRTVVLDGDPWIMDVEGVCSTLAHLPSAQSVRELTVAMTCRSHGDPPQIMRDLDFAPSLAALTIRLRVESAMTTPADLARLYPKLGQLEDLRVDVKDLELGTIVLPKLRRMELRADLHSNMRSLSNATWPELTTLRLFDTTRDAIDFTALLASEALASVKHLALGRRVNVGALLGAPVLRHLATLDLSNARIDDSHAELLIAGADALRHLEHLDLSDNQMSAPIAERLARALGSERRAALLGVAP